MDEQGREPPVGHPLFEERPWGWGLHMEPKCHRWAAVFGTWSWVGAQSSWMGWMGRIQQAVLVLQLLLVPDNLTEAAGGGRASESGPPELAWGTNIPPCPEQDDGNSARKPMSTPPGPQRPCAAPGGTDPVGSVPWAPEGLSELLLLGARPCPNCSPSSGFVRVTGQCVDRVSFIQAQQVPKPWMFWGLEKVKGLVPARPHT